MKINSEICLKNIAHKACFNRVSYIKQLIFVFTAFCCSSAQFALSMNVDQRMVNVKTTVDEPAVPIYYFSANDGTKLIVDRSLTELCIPLEDLLSAYLTVTPGDPSAEPAICATAHNPLPLSDQIPGYAIRTWMTALKILKSNPTSYRDKLNAHFSSLSDKQLLDTSDAAHYFELHKNNVASLLQCSPMYARDIIERTASQEFFKRFSRRQSDLRQLSLSKTLQTRLIDYAAMQLSTIIQLHCHDNYIPWCALPAEYKNKESVYNVCYSPDNSSLASRTHHHISINPFRTDAHKVTVIDQGSSWLGVYGICYNPAGNHLATAFNERSIAIIDTKKNSIIHTLIDPDICNTFSFAPSGSFLAVGCRNGFVNLYETATYTKAKSFLWGSRINGLCFHPQQDIFYFGTGEGKLGSCSIENGTCRHLESDSCAVKALAISPDGTNLASAQASHNYIRLWDTNTCRKTTQLYTEEAITNIAWHPTSNYLAALRRQCDSDKVLLFDLRMNKALFGLFSGKTLFDIAFNPYGTELAIAGSNGLIYRCNISEPPKNLNHACLFEAWLDREIEFNYSGLI